MAFTKDSGKQVIRNVTNIDEHETTILAFLQGAVYCWCKNRKDEWFSIRDLMGGDNYYWAETPMENLFNKHYDEEGDKELAIKAAGKDSGWLLKKVIDKDKRIFETKNEALIRKYRWNGKQK